MSRSQPLPLAPPHLPAARTWTEAEVFALLDDVRDPELPVVSLTDLGVLRSVVCAGGASETRVTVELTPTYSGCPALEVMVEDVRSVLLAAGVVGAEVVVRLSPPWSSDDLTPRGRERLAAAAILPPRLTRAGLVALTLLPPRPRADAEGTSTQDSPGACPLCGSLVLERLSEFGPSACRALWRCTSCREPVEEFKSLPSH